MKAFVELNTYLSFCLYTLTKQKDLLKTYNNTINGYFSLVVALLDTYFPEDHYDHLRSKIINIIYLLSVNAILIQRLQEAFVHN